MHKQSVKNFICSFLFSLLAVVLVNKVFMHTPEINSTAPEVPVKKHNISLFSAAGGIPTAAIDSQHIDISEIERLTASVSNKTADTQEENPPSVGILPPPPAEAAKSTVIAENLPDSASGFEIQKQAAAQEISAARPHKTPATQEQAGSINTDLAAAEEIVLEKENIIIKADTTNDYEKSGIIYADISDTFTAEEAAEDVNDRQIVLYAPENGNNAKAEAAIPAVAADASGNVVLAENNASFEESDIPLLEGNETLHAQIDVVSNASASQIAMLEPNNLVSTIDDFEEPEEKTLAEADLKQNEWTQMSEQDDNDSPWVVAKGNKFAKNQAVVEFFADKEENTDLKAPDTAESDAGISQDGKSISAALKPETNAETEKETKVAYQMIQNLLIPIPEDLANSADLTPQLTASPKDKSNNDKDAERKAAAEGKLNDAEKQSGLFKSIASWFSSDKKEQPDKTQKTPKKSSGKKSGIDFFGFMSGDDANSGTTQILPAELRLSFQPNRAEISGQTLRWIHAFADNARDNDDMYIEIRIDGTSSFALQKKRLNLLSTILANRGVDFRKINIIFTSREPNSFIIRNIRFNNDEETVMNKNSGSSYYRPW